MKKPKTLIQCTRCKEYAAVVHFVKNQPICADCHTLLEVSQLRTAVEQLDKLKAELREIFKNLPNGEKS